MRDGDRSRRRLILSITLAVVAAVVIGAGLGLVVRHNRTPADSLISPVQPTSRVVPVRIASLSLLDGSGKATDLAAFHGRVVVLANFMTSCQEECPITTGALLDVERALSAAHLANRVSILEVSVDPWRDDPGRLRAYAKKFGVPWTMLTGSVANLGKFWSWFGSYAERVKEGTPPGTDWQTGKPYTFDIVHSDEVFVLGPSGNERALAEGNADIGGKLPSALAGLLSAQGRTDLTHPGLASWTPTELLAQLGSVLGRSIPS